MSSDNREIQKTIRSSKNASDSFLSQETLFSVIIKVPLYQYDRGAFIAAA